MNHYEYDDYIDDYERNSFVLPRYWETRISEDGTKMFYKNNNTKETQWKIPLRINSYDLSDDDISDDDDLPDDTEKPLVGIINKSGLPNLPEELIEKIYKYNDDFVIETYSKLSIGLEKLIKEIDYVGASIDMIRVKSYLKEAKLISLATAESSIRNSYEINLSLKSIYSYGGYYVLFTYATSVYKLDDLIDITEDITSDQTFDLSSFSGVEKMSKQLFKVIPKNKFNYVKWLQDIIGVIPVRDLHKEIYGEYWIKPYVKYISSL
jgi:hypothetical protein